MVVSLQVVVAKSIDRPPSACLKIRIFSAVLYFLPFIRLVGARNRSSLIHRSRVL